jgi:hypothetical protein
MDRYEIDWTELDYEDTCDHCGEPSTADDPIADHQIAPPADGFNSIIVHVHKSCGAHMARMLVM